MGGVCFQKTNRDGKDGGALIDFFDGDGLVGDVCFLKTKKEEKARGAQIDFFDGDRMVRGVHFPKMSKGRMVGGPSHPSPAGRVGAY